VQKGAEGSSSGVLRVPIGYRGGCFGCFYSNQGAIGCTGFHRVHRVQGGCREGAA